jgi:hypothetical protein
VRFSPGWNPVKEVTITTCMTYFRDSIFKAGPKVLKKCQNYGLLRVRVIILENKFQKFFVSAMNMLLIYLFASMKLEKGHKK